MLTLHNFKLLHFILYNNCNNTNIIVREAINLKYAKYSKKETKQICLWNQKKTLGTMILLTSKRTLKLKSFQLFEKFSLLRR